MVDQRWYKTNTLKWLNGKEPQKAKAHSVTDFFYICCFSLHHCINSGFTPPYLCHFNHLAMCLGQLRGSIAPFPFSITNTSNCHTSMHTLHRFLSVIICLSITELWSSAQSGKQPVHTETYVKHNTHTHTSPAGPLVSRTSEYSSSPRLCGLSDAAAQWCQLRGQNLFCVCFSLSSRQNSTNLMA